MTWWQYLILANVYLLLFYGFYAMLLRKETFFQLNRVYLVSTAILSFMVPLIQADWARNLFITRQLKQTIYHFSPGTIYLPVQQEQHFTIGSALVIVYLAGIVVLSVRLAIQLLMLRRKMRNPASDESYSFFKTIRLSEAYQPDSVIMEHEQVHAQQWHSADVLLIEAIMIINWFNPAVYFYRKAIKHIHEFIADRKAISTGTTKQEYALLLLSETFKSPASNLVNPFFNHSLLKQRIIMLQRSNSGRAALLKYGLSAPLFALMLILTSATTNTTRVIGIINKKAELVLDMPASAHTLTTLTLSDQKAQSASATLTVKDFTPAAHPLSDKLKATDEVFTVAEQSAEFPGGNSALGHFLATHIKISDPAKSDRVIISFVVETDGSLSDIKGLTGTKEDINIVAQAFAGSPKWLPARQNGLKVRMQMNIPVTISGSIESAAPLNEVKDSSQVRRIVIRHIDQTVLTGTVPDDSVRRIAGIRTTQMLKDFMPPDNSKMVKFTSISHDTSGKIMVFALNNPVPSNLKLTNGNYPRKIIYYLNDAECTPAQVQQLNPKMIKSISVYADSEKLPGSKDAAIIKITTTPIN